MRVLDYGKMAATFVDTQTERAVRISPRLDARRQAQNYAPEAQNHWEAYLLGYQRMPDEKLLQLQPVTLALSLEKLLSKEGYRVECERCGEEIFNEREIKRDGQILCRSCAGEGYYRLPIQTKIIGNR
jgi:formylmethanofuran dehydrogenase subunit E